MGGDTGSPEKNSFCLVSQLEKTRAAQGETQRMKPGHILRVQCIKHKQEYQMKIALHSKGIADL